METLNTSEKETKNQKDRDKSSTQKLNICYNKEKVLPKKGKVLTTDMRKT